MVTMSIYGTTTEYYTDSLSSSFASVRASAKSAVLAATVRTMGKVADYDRPFKVVVDKEGSTAVEGEHYEIDLDTLVVRAGESSARVRVRFFRTADLMKRTIRLVLRLEDNEYFKCYFPEYKNTNAYSSTGVMIHGNLFAFSVSEMYTEPGYWTDFGTEFFGNWTPEKYVVVNSVCGLTPTVGVVLGMPGRRCNTDGLIFSLSPCRNICRNRRMPEPRNWTLTGNICNLTRPTRSITPGMNNIKTRCYENELYYIVFTCCFSLCLL